MTTVLRCNTTRTGKSCTLHNFTVILYLQHTCFTTRVFIQRSQSNRKHSQYFYEKIVGFFTSRLRHGHTEANVLVVLVGTFYSQIFLTPLNHPYHLNHINHLNRRNHINHLNCPNHLNYLNHPNHLNHHNHLHPPNHLNCPNHLNNPNHLNHPNLLQPF